LIKKKKRNSLFKPIRKELQFNSFFVLLEGIVLFLLSVSQIKNLARRLENLEGEACQELDRACGNELWRNIGFEAFDGLQDSERRSRANYYYGQLQTVREIQSVFH
tara:strand:- start:1787 stop:2104 length:318 start_codon:yes stop_codon:yes gene_type:complete